MRTVADPLFFFSLRVLAHTRRVAAAKVAYTFIVVHIEAPLLRRR
jgi:hypothetical protein